MKEHPEVPTLFNTMCSYFPPEVYDCIIDYFDGDVHALGVCALVSRDWVPRSRANMFSTIIVTVDNDTNLVSDTSIPQNYRRPPTPKPIKDPVWQGLDLHLNMWAIPKRADFPPKPNRWTPFAQLLRQNRNLGLYVRTLKLMGNIFGGNYGPKIDPSWFIEPQPECEVSSTGGELEGVVVLGPPPFRLSHFPNIRMLETRLFDLNLKDASPFIPLRTRTLPNLESLAFTLSRFVDKAIPSVSYPSDTMAFDLLPLNPTPRKLKRLAVSSATSPFQSYAPIGLARTFIEAGDLLQLDSLELGSSDACVDFLPFLSTSFGAALTHITVGVIEEMHLYAGNQFDLSSRSREWYFLHS